MDGISFKGNLGNKFVQDITVKGRQVQPGELLNAAKGKFGLSKEKTADIFESMIEGLEKGTKENNFLTKKIQEMLDGFAKELETVKENARVKLAAEISNVVSDYKEKLAAKDARISELEKYEGMAKVKSIEDLDTVMPETVIKTAEEMSAMHNEARDGMLNYLLTGKGQEPVLEYLGKNNIMLKAMEDEITAIPEVAKALNTSKPHYASPAWCLKSLAYDALKNEKGSVILSPVIRKQIEKNLMGLIEPYCDNSNGMASVDYMTKVVGQSFWDLMKFHKDLDRTKQEMAHEFPGKKIVYNQEKGMVDVLDKDGTLIRGQLIF